MQIRWEADAIADLSDLRSFIKHDNPTAANRIAGKIIDATNLLNNHPLLGKPGRIHTTRELVVSGTPYTLIYLVEAEVVSILRIFHQARQWKHVLDDDQ
jgi:toxin ParE1/3/4